MLIERFVVRSVPWVWLGDPSQLGPVTLRGNISQLEGRIDLGFSNYSSLVRPLSNEWCPEVRGDQDHLQNDQSSEGLSCFHGFS